MQNRETKPNLSILSLPLLALLLLLVFSAPASASTTSGWYSGARGYADARSEQKRLNAALVVYFYADWCPYCRRLDQDILPSPEMAAFLNQVVKVRISPENGPEEDRLADLFGVHGYPSFFIVASPSAYPIKLYPFVRQQGRISAVPSQVFAMSCRQTAGLPAPSVMLQTPKEPNVGLGKEVYRGLGKSVERSAGKTAAATSGSKTGDVESRRRQPGAPASAGADFVKIDATGPLPTVDEVLDRYLEAIGGSAAITAATSLLAKGTVDIPGVSSGGAFEIQAKAPDKTLITVNIYPVGRYRFGSNGRVSWEQSAQSGTRTIPRSGVNAITYGSGFERPMRLKTAYPGMKLLGKAKFGFRETFAVEMTGLKGETARAYFDLESSLLFRVDVTDGRANGTIYLSDWREVDGVKMPFRITASFGKATVVLRFEEVKHNVVIDDRIFEKPQ